jgi:hypothetical protein
MHDKSQTETTSAGNVPSQHSFPQTFDENEQLRTDTSSQRIETCEFIDSEELARRWHVPVSWMRDQVRKRAEDPLPHVSLGKYVRFLWGSPALELWIRRRIVMGNNRRLGRTR